MFGIFTVLCAASEKFVIPIYSIGVIVFLLFLIEGLIRGQREIRLHSAVLGGSQLYRHGSLLVMLEGLYGVSGMKCGLATMQGRKVPSLLSYLSGPTIYFCICFPVFNLVPGISQYLYIFFSDLVMLSDYFRALGSEVTPENIWGPDEVDAGR